MTHNFFYHFRTSSPPKIYRTKHLQTIAPPSTCLGVSQYFDAYFLPHYPQSSPWHSFLNPSNFLSEACIAPKCHPVSFSARSLRAYSATKYIISIKSKAPIGTFRHGRFWLEF